MPSDDNRFDEISQRVTNARNEKTPASNAPRNKGLRGKTVNDADLKQSLISEATAPEATAPEATVPDAIANSATSAGRGVKPGDSRLRVWWLAWASGAMVAITAFWLLATRWGLGRDDWFVTPRRVWWTPGVWLLPIAVLALFGGLAMVSAYDRFRRAKSRGEQKTSVRLCVFALMLFALCWPWASLGPTPGGASGASNLIAATWSDVANGYFSQAYRIRDARRFSRDYVARQQTDYAQTQAHVATHPPGATLFYFAARRAFEASPPVQKTFIAVHRNMTGASIAESAAFSRNMVSVGTGTRPTLPDSAAPCALWCAFLLSLCVALTVPAAYLLGAGNHRGNDIREDDMREDDMINAPFSSARETRASIENEVSNARGKFINGLCAAQAFEIPMPGNPTASGATSDVAVAARSTNAQDRIEARGLVAAALFALAPAVGLFAFTLDALVGLLTAWTLVLVARRLGGGAAWQMIAAGALLAGNSFFSFGALASGVVIALSVFLRAMRAREMESEDVFGTHDVGRDVGGAKSANSRLARRVVFNLALCALGFVGLWVLLCALLPMQPVAIFERAMQAHHQATGNRNRWGWAAINLGMFALFCGWPVAFACLSLGARHLKSRERHRALHAASPTPDKDDAMKSTLARGASTSGDTSGDTARIVGTAMLLTLLLLTLSGNVRGEAERLWMFALAPLCALAAQICVLPNELSPDKTRPAGTSRAVHEYSVVIALLLLQTLQCVLMTGALAPLVRPF